MTLTASAPGKVVVAGEYAVLDGAPAIAIAIDRRAVVTVKPRVSGYNTVTAPGFSAVEGRFTYASGRFVWQAGGDDYGLVESVWKIGRPDAFPAADIVLDTSHFFDGLSGRKLGIGSSAALATALSAAITGVAGPEAFTLARSAHRALQRGTGSGIDVASSVMGGTINYRMSDARPVAAVWPPGLSFALFWSGTSASTAAKLQTLEQGCTHPSRDELKRAAQRLASRWESADTTVILDELRRYTEALRRFGVDHDLGIFDAGHGVLADDAGDVVYKPCGAGGGDIGIALATDTAALDAFAEIAVANGFERLDMTIEPHGVLTARNNQ